MGDKLTCRLCGSDDMHLEEHAFDGISQPMPTELLPNLSLARMKPRPGVPYPLGATYDRSGVNFAVASEGATAVELCLFGEAEGDQETARFEVAEQTDRVWLHCATSQEVPLG